MTTIKRDAPDKQDLKRKTRLLTVDGLIPSISRQKYALRVKRGPAAGKEYLTASPKITVGSAELCNLVLDDTTISGKHFEISQSGDDHVITDLESTNGTKLNGVKVLKAVLQPGYTIDVGKTRIVFDLLDDAEQVMLYPESKFHGLLGESVKMREIFMVLDQVGGTEGTVLIQGETGTGKELVAQALHDRSPRRDKPFMVLDCGAVSKSLLESELFGHTRGAFTGAASDRAGAFEAARGGTIFLDEIGEMDLDLQPKLLRVIESRQVKRLGSNTFNPVDIRLVAATNRDLEQEVTRGRFREDLFYRLAVVPVMLPSLRERKEDISLLAHAFYHALTNNPDAELPAELLARFQDYHWPGNVRELKNMVERFTFMPNTPVSALLRYRATPRQQEDLLERLLAENLPYVQLKDKLAEMFEKKFVLKKLNETGGNVSAAARAAGMTRRHMQRLMKKHEVGTLSRTVETDDEG